MDEMDLYRLRVESRLATRDRRFSRIGGRRINDSKLPKIITLPVLLMGLGILVFGLILFLNV